MRDIFIGCDSGTQSVKVTALRLDGREYAFSTEAHPPPRFDADGGAEQDAELLAQALFRALQRIGARVGKKRIAAIAVTTQRDSLLAFRDGRPIHPMFLWMDRRSLASTRVPRRFRDEPYASWYRNSRARWLEANAPKAADHVTHWGTLGAWYHLLLCDRFSESAAALSFALPVARRPPAWSPDPKAWEAVGVATSMLPAAVPAGAVVGPLSPAGSRRTGLPAGIPVVATGGDKNCEIVGGGACGPESGVLSLGTALSLGTMVEDPDPYLTEPSLWVTPAPLAGLWTVEAGVPGGLWTLEWLADLLSLDAKQMERQAMAVPPGSEGVTFLPHLSGTVADPMAGGIITGLSPRHGPGHLYRAALEGLAFESRRARNAIERMSGLEMKSIRLAGGGAGSPLLRGILAAVLGRRLQMPTQSAVGARGAAVVASLAIRPGGVADRARKFSGDLVTISSSSSLKRDYARLYEFQYLRWAPVSALHGNASRRTTSR